MIRNNTPYSLVRTHLTPQDILRLLNRMWHYQKLSDENISLTSVCVNRIHSSCRFLKQSSIDAVRPICEAYLNHKIPVFLPSLLTTRAGSTHLLPPILEHHEGKYVIVDGTHRLFLAKNYFQLEQVFCITLNNTPELPGIPIPFDEVEVKTHRMSRWETFNRYQKELFRDFRPLEDALRIFAHNPQYD